MKTMKMGTLTPNREKGFNIDVTRGQYMMLYNIMCEHNQMVNPQANPALAKLEAGVEGTFQLYRIL